MKIQTIFGLLFLSVLLSGCGDGQKDSGLDFQIKLKEVPSEASKLLTASLHNLSAPGGISIATGPSTISDFSCFAVNITGDGIASNGRLGNGCTISGRFLTTGVGYITEPVTRGTTINADVPSGPARRIDAYGVYPPDSNCGGSGGTSNGGYFLGSQTIDLLKSTSVTIPIAYNGVAGADVTCTNTNNSFSPVTLVVDILNVNGMYYGTSCQQSTSLSATGPGPGVSLGDTALTVGTDKPKLASQDSSLDMTECTSASTFDTAVVNYSFGLGALNVSQAASLTVNWVGQLGYYAGSCNGATAPSGVLAGSESPGVEIWNANAGQWQVVGSTIAASTSLSRTATFSTPGFFTVGNTIYIRVVGSKASTVGYCSTIQTDFISLSVQ